MPSGDYLKVPLKWIAVLSNISALIINTRLFQWAVSYIDNLASLDRRDMHLWWKTESKT